MFNSVKFDLADAHDKYLLYSQFVAWYCKGLSIAPLLDCAHNPTCQKLPTMSECFTSADENLFVDLRREKGYTNEIKKLNRDNSDLSVTIMLKNAAAKKMRLRVIGYYQDEHLNLLSHNGLNINYKEYGVKKQETSVN